MQFVEISGLSGKVYVPENQQGSPQKHPCKDCYFCQMCSDDRCRFCLSPKNRKCQKPSEK